MNGKASLDRCAARVAHAGAEGRVRGKDCGWVGHALSMVFGHQKAVDAVFNRFGNAGVAGGYDRDFGAYRLQNRDGRAFAVAIGGGDGMLQEYHATEGKAAAQFVSRVKGIATIRPLEHRQ